MKDTPREKLLQTIKDPSETHTAPWARAVLDTQLAESLVGAIDRLSSSTAKLNGRIVFLNWMLVALTVILVIIGLFGLRGVCR